MCREITARLIKKQIRTLCPLLLCLTCGAGAWGAGSDTERFLEKHWSRPLPLQGEPHPGLSPVERSLQPEDCGRCHPQQFEGWRGSRHALAMGPGIMGQLVNMPAEDREQHQSCIRCHAPLGEQADSLAENLATGREEGLHLQGLICAACHLRNYRWYGPPRRDGSLPPDDVTGIPHRAWASSLAFSDSRFCAACHQFEPDGFALNGKLLENTYQEWKESPAAEEGKSCQSCHMPERQHLWRGIHDPEMVKSGVEFHLTPPSLEGDTLSTQLTITNSGVGHHFPTYVTPRVVVTAYQEGSDGRRLEGTGSSGIIGRQVTLDLSREIADTRIAQGERSEQIYRMARHPEAVALVFQVRVEPDAFYTGFYRALLDGNYAGRGEPAIRTALKESQESAYTLYFSRQQLP